MILAKIALQTHIVEDMKHNLSGLNESDPGSHSECASAIVDELVQEDSWDRIFTDHENNETDSGN